MKRQPIGPRLCSRLQDVQEAYLSRVRGPFDEFHQDRRGRLTLRNRDRDDPLLRARKSAVGTRAPTIRLSSIRRIHGRTAGLHPACEGAWIHFGGDSRVAGIVVQSIELRPHSATGREEDCRHRTEDSLPATDEAVARQNGGALPDEGLHGGLPARPQDQETICGIRTIVTGEDTLR